MLMTATVAPVGVEAIYETIMPAVKQNTEIAAAVIITDLNRLHTRMADSDGKIIRLEISSAPIILIPRTTVTDVSTAISVL